MEHIEPICSLEFKLSFLSVCSIRIRSRIRYNHQFQGANQIPDSLINDPILNEMISAALPSNYNFEIHKTIFKIQSIKQTKKRIALQFPEGLLLFATTISEILEKYTGCVCIIMG